MNLQNFLSHTSPKPAARIVGIGVWTVYFPQTGASIKLLLPFPLKFLATCLHALETVLVMGHSRSEIHYTLVPTNVSQ